MDPDLASFLAAEPKGSPRQQEADRRLCVRLAALRVRHRRGRAGEALTCLYDVALDMAFPERTPKQANRIRTQQARVARAVECLESVDLDVSGVLGVCDSLAELLAVAAVDDEACVAEALEAIERLGRVDVKGARSA